MRYLNPRLGQKPFEALAGGSGGAASTSTKVTFEEHQVAIIDFTAVNEAVDTGIPVPANTKTIEVNYGASTDDATAGVDLLWINLPIEEWNRLEGVDVGDAPTMANARFTRIWRDPNITTVGGVGARQVWLLKGNNGNIFVMSDNTGWDIHPFRVRFEIHENVSGSGGSGSGTTLTPETDELIVYEEADEHNIININGKPYEVVRAHHDGHGKDVSLEELTHVNFRGFIDRVNNVLEPADGQFVYVYSESLGIASGFERYTTAGVTGWYPYRPFDAGNEWENAPAGFTYTGALTYRGYRQDEADLIRVAGAAGQVFVLLDERQVMFVNEFTAELKGYFYFKTQNVVPTRVGPVSMVAFWGEGQSSVYDRSGSHREAHAFQNGTEYTYRLQFNDSEPDEIIYGDDFGVRAVVAADAPNADLMVGTPTGGVETTEVLADHAVLTFPAGKYLVSLRHESVIRNDNDTGIRSYEIQSDADDFLISARTYASSLIDLPPGLTGSITNESLVIDSVVESLTEIQLTFFHVGANDLTPFDGITTVAYITKLEG